MEHRKRFLKKEKIISHTQRSIFIEGPVEAASLQNYKMHESLDAFRRPKDQYEALIEIAELPEGRIIIARDDSTIVGYVTFHYPDDFEQWSKGNMADLVELGAIEVADPYRNYGLGKDMITLAFAEQQLDNMIVFTTEYYWHWDLDGSGLNVWDYRKMMEKLMQSVDMIWFATDDPEICAHPANCLMVKIGPEVPQSSVEQFDSVRFRNRWMY